MITVLWRQQHLHREAKLPNFHGIHNHPPYYSFLIYTRCPRKLWDNTRLHIASYVTLQGWGAYWRVSTSHTWGPLHMDTLPAELALCVGNLPVTAGFHHKGALMQGFGVSFVVSLNKLLNKLSNWQWFEMPWHWYDVTVLGLLCQPFHGRGQDSFKSIETWKIQRGNFTSTEI